MSVLRQKRQNTDRGPAGARAGAAATNVARAGGRAGLRNQLRESNYEEGRHLVSAKPEENPESAQQEAVEDFGEISSFGDDFYAAAGGILESLLPNPGDEGRAQVNVNLPVTASGNVRVGFEFSVKGERLEDGGMKSRCEAAINISAEFDTWLVDAFVQAGLFGYLEAQGDSGAEVFRLFSLAIYDRVAGASQRAADAVWGEGFVDETVAQMDADDYAQSGVGVEVAAGLGTAEEADGLEAEAGVKVSTGTKLTAKDGALEEADVKTLEVSASVSIDGWEGEVTGTFSKGGGKSGDIEFVGRRKVTLADSPDLFDNEAVREMLIHWATGVADALIGAVDSKDTSHRTSRKVGAIASAIREISGIDSLALGSAGVAALRSLPGDSVKFEQLLTIGGGWEDDEGFANVSFDRRTKLEVGEDERDLVYVLLENTQQLFDWNTSFSVAAQPALTAAGVTNKGGTLTALLSAGAVTGGPLGPLAAIGASVLNAAPKSETEPLLEKATLSAEEIRKVRVTAKNLPPEQAKELYRQVAAKTSYRNQRNNQGEYAGDGDYMCNWTAIAMVLNQMGIGLDESQGQMEDQLDAAHQGNRYSRSSRGAEIENKYGVGQETPDHAVRRCRWAASLVRKERQAALRARTGSLHGQPEPRSVPMEPHRPHRVGRVRRRPRGRPLRTGCLGRRQVHLLRRQPQYARQRRGPGSRQPLDVGAVRDHRLFRRLLRAFRLGAVESSSGDGQGWGGGTPAQQRRWQDASSPGSPRSSNRLQPQTASTRFPPNDGARSEGLEHEATAPRRAVEERRQECGLPERPCRYVVLCVTEQNSPGVGGVGGVGGVVQCRRIFNDVERDDNIRPNVASRRPAVPQCVDRRQQIGLSAHRVLQHGPCVRTSRHIVPALVGGFCIGRFRSRWAKERKLMPW